MTDVSHDLRFFKTVLDKGVVDLLDVMPYPTQVSDMDMAVVTAARVSYLGESKGEKADKKLLFYLMENHHSGPFEQAVFKFRIRAPLIVWWQMVRHRTASINMQSGRYTEFEEDEFYIPEAWRKQDTINRQGSRDVIDIAAGTLTDALEAYYIEGYTLYKAALAVGVAREQARLFLPGFAVYYTGVWTMDAHNLMHFLELRLHPHAQYEIRKYAETIYEIFKTCMPWTAEAFEKFRLHKGEG